MRYGPYFAAASFTAFGLVSGNYLWLAWAGGVAVIYVGWQLAERAGRRRRAR
jgi:hypothetical protein